MYKGGYFRYRVNLLGWNLYGETDLFLTERHTLFENPYDCDQVAQKVKDAFDKWKDFK